MVDDEAARHRDTSDRAKVDLDLPLVSVVVICYNHAPFIEKCLTSVFAQTYRRIEVIVVENLSTDNSRSVIERFLDKDFAVPFTPIYSDHNGRELGAMLQGFAAARGRYICFVDGDDWLLPQCVATHIKAHLVSRVAVGVTSVDMYQSFDNDVVVGTGKRIAKFVMSKRGQAADFVRMENLAAFDFGEDGAMLTRDDLHLVPPSMGHEWHWSPTSGLCFRREMVDLLLTPPPAVRDGVDGYLVRGTCCLTGGIVIDRSLAVYRMHGNNLFATHPALENLLQFKNDQNEDLDANICGSVVARLRDQTPELSQKLEVADIYIEAVHAMSRVSLGRHERTYSSYTVRFLLDNKELLQKYFGAGTYKYWRWRYMKVRDYLALARGGRS